MLPVYQGELFNETLPPMCIQSANALSNSGCSLKSRILAM